MSLRVCGWDYCRTTHPRAYGDRCPEHRDMKWWQEFIEHLEHLCWEEEELPLGEFDDALDIVHDARLSGGPKEAALTLESEYGIDPSIFGERFERNS